VVIVQEKCMFYQLLPVFS